jgi:hypothetical protein
MPAILLLVGLLAAETSVVVLTQWLIAEGESCRMMSSKCSRRVESGHARTAR